MEELYESFDNIPLNTSVVCSVYQYGMHNIELVYEPKQYKMPPVDKLNIFNEPNDVTIHEQTYRDLCKITIGDIVQYVKRRTKFYNFKEYFVTMTYTETILPDQFPKLNKYHYDVIYSRTEYTNKLLPFRLIGKNNNKIWTYCLSFDVNKNRDNKQLYEQVIKHLQ